MKRAQVTSREKLKLIEVPGVQFFDSPLSEAMTELQRQARQFDLTEPDPAKKGLNIIPLIGEEEEPLYHHAKFHATW